ncbi:MAG: hypothetical protein R3B97_00785 [Dehalococcoidia bacterium]
MADWPPGRSRRWTSGKLRSIVDVETGKRQTVWALLIVLPYSRHCFAWPLVQQTLAEASQRPRSRLAFLRRCPPAADPR